MVFDESSRFVLFGAGGSRYAVIIGGIMHAGFRGLIARFEAFVIWRRVWCTEACLGSFGRKLATCYTVAWRLFGPVLCSRK